MAEQQTVLEGIVESVTTDLYNQWVVALPQSEKTEEKFKSLQKMLTILHYLLFKILWIDLMQQQKS